MYRNMQLHKAQYFSQVCQYIYNKLTLVCHPTEKIMFKYLKFHSKPYLITNNSKKQREISSGFHKLLNRPQGWGGGNFVRPDHFLLKLLDLIISRSNCQTWSFPAQIARPDDFQLNFHRLEHFQLKFADLLIFSSNFTDLNIFSWNLQIWSFPAQICRLDHFQLIFRRLGHCQPH